VDAGPALEELTRLSADIQRAALLDDSGAVLAASPDADGARLADAAASLLETAASLDPGRPVERVVVTLPRGAVVAVRGGGRVAVAATGPEPAAALVVHDLRACLTAVAGDA
jgi:hypothetical protein